MLKNMEQLLSEVMPNIKRISAEQAKVLVQTEPNVQVIDVREPNEVAEQPIELSVNIPRGVLEMNALRLFPNADQAILLHCKSGARACLAAEQLQRLGYNRVQVIYCKAEELL